MPICFAELLKFQAKFRTCVYGRCDRNKDVGSQGMWFGPVLAVRPVSEISIWQGVQLLASHWFLALLSPSPVCLRTPLLFGARPCLGDASDLAMALMNPSCLKQPVSQQRWTTRV
jgi:hypothetical protein